MRIGWQSEYTSSSSSTPYRISELIILGVANTRSIVVEQFSVYISIPFSSNYSIKIDSVISRSFSNPLSVFAQIPPQVGQYRLISPIIIYSLFIPYQLFKAPSRISERSFIIGLVFLLSSQLQILQIRIFLPSIILTNKIAKSPEQKLNLYQARSAFLLIKKYTLTSLLFVEQASSKRSLSGFIIPLVIEFFNGSQIVIILILLTSSLKKRSIITGLLLSTLYYSILSIDQLGRYDAATIPLLSVFSNSIRL